MMSLLISLLACCLCLAGKAYAADKLVCGTACQTPFNYISFTGDPVTSGTQYGMKCYNLLRAESVYTCMRSRCSSEEIDAALGYFAYECDGSVYSFSVIDNITDADEASWYPLTFADLTSSGNYTGSEYTTPVAVSDSLFELSWKTNAQGDGADTHQDDYGYAMYGFWGGVVLIGILNRLYTLLMAWLSREAAEPTVQRNGIMTRLSKWKQRHITTPALFGYHCAHPLGWCTIPPRLQSATIISYMILNLVLCSVSYHTFDDNLNLPTKKLQLFEYVGNRCGYMALTNLPVLWMFAQRNDVLIWLTGWSFTTYNLFHRWVARIATVQAIIHGSLYTAFVFVEGGETAYSAEWHKRFWWMGVISVSSMSLLCGFSIYPIRKRVYEFFLAFHITFAVLLLIAISFHVRMIGDHFKHFVWPCVAIWSLDRVCRIGRIVSVNRLFSKSTATYNRDANTVTLDVPVRSWLRPKPGSYYFVYIMHGAKPWESHPFTLSSWTLPSSSGQKQSLHLSFIIRPHHSFTKRLRNLVGANSARGGPETTADGDRVRCPVRAVVEGPYGGSDSYELHGYKRVLFIIGGSGITVALAFFRSMVDRLKEGKPVRVEQISLVWAVRNAAMFTEVFGDELGALWGDENSEMRKQNIKLQIDLYISDLAAQPYRSSASSLESPTAAADEKAEEAGLGNITGDGDDSSRSSSSSGGGGGGGGSGSHMRSHHRDIPQDGHKSPVNGVSEKLGRERSDLPHNVNIVCHRANIQDIVTAEAAAYATNGQKMAIVCCGPSRMADDARAATMVAIRKGYDGIAFYPELFSW